MKNNPNAFSAEKARKKTKKNVERKNKINQYIKWQEESIRKASEKGCRKTCFAYGYNMIEVREYFKNLGYTFKPTGYCCGVWQDSEDICW